MDCYTDIIKKAERELEDILRNDRDGFQNMEELKKADLLTHTIKSAYGAMQMREMMDGQSRRGGGYEVEPPATRDRMGRLPGVAYGEYGGSYRGSSSYRGGRSMGGSSYGSNEDEAVELLEQAMMAVKDEQAREEIRQMIRSVKDR